MTIQAALRCSVVCAIGTITLGAIAQDVRAILAARVTKLTRESQWTLTATVPISFRTYHPQGLVKIGEHFIVSSVEVRVPTRRLPRVVDGYDRDTGEGVGHLFKFDMTGKLIAGVKLGAGAVYHPGGIDFDGRYVWVPVAEYRPNGRSVVYRVDSETMTATQMFAYDDHIGAIVHDTDNNTLHGVDWGSRAFYRWTLDARGQVTNADAAPEAIRTFNPSHYLDYQDCKYVGRERMLCTGVTEIRRTLDAPLFRLGGIDLVHLGDGRPVHQVPLLLWTSDGLDMTHNAVWLEPSADGVRGYFLPEDDKSNLYIYDAKTP